MKFNAGDRVWFLHEMSGGEPELATVVNLHHDSVYPYLVTVDSFFDDGMLFLAKEKELRLVDEH